VGTAASLVGAAGTSIAGAAAISAAGATSTAGAGATTRFAAGATASTFTSAGRKFCKISYPPLPNRIRTTTPTAVFVPVFISDQLAIYIPPIAARPVAAPCFSSARNSDIQAKRNSFSRIPRP
jgi:hypothetical protein